jgi:hypothetical protein
VFPRLSERAKAILFVAVLGVTIASLWAYASAAQPPPVAPRSVQVDLVIEGGGWSLVYTANGTLNNTAFSILREASARLGFDLDYMRYTLPPGVFVTSINGTPNGEGGSFWQYWVDGVYGNRAADQYELHDGDSVRWAFVPPQEGAS